jgi:hypothetical protein
MLANQMDSVELSRNWKESRVLGDFRQARCIVLCSMFEIETFDALTLHFG